MLRVQAIKPIVHKKHVFLYPNVRKKHITYFFGGMRIAEKLKIGKIAEQLDCLCWMVKATRGCHAQVLANCGIGLLRISVSLLFVYVCKTVVDVATRKMAGSLNLWICIMIGIMLLQLVLFAWAARVRERNRITISNMIQKRMFGKALYYQGNASSGMHTGDITNRLETDVATLSTTTAELIPQIILAICQLLAAALILFTMQKELLWVLLVIMPIAIIVSKTYYVVLRKYTAEIRKTEGDMQSHIQEHLLKRMLITCMGRTDRAIEHLGSMQDSLFGLVRNRVNYSTRARFFVQLGFMGGYCTTFCWGAYGLMAGTVTYGMMTAFLQLVNQIQNPVVNMSHSMPAVIQAMTSIDRLRELDQLPQRTKEEQHLMPGSVGIRISNLSYTYPDNPKPTLLNTNYDFAPGTSIAIMGETGAGKSTLIRLMLGMMKADSGSITLYNNKEELPISPALLCNFMYVPQGNSLMSTSIRENLLMGNEQATEEEMRQALHLAAADFVLGLPEGLDTMCTEQGARLSEGQAQRIAIARALLQKGSILLLDEASSALDEETERLILANISALTPRKTVIWVTHHTSVREKMDMSIVVKN